MDIAGNRLAVMHSWLLDFGERDNTPSLCKISFISHHQPQNFTEILSKKPKARGQGNDCCLFQPYIIHRIF